MFALFKRKISNVPCYHNTNININCTFLIQYINNFFHSNFIEVLNLKSQRRTKGKACKTRK